MTNTRVTDLKDAAAQTVATALAGLGEATAHVIHEASGVAYSTTNKKLRKLEDAGLAETVKGYDGRIRWRLTASGQTTLDEANTTGQAPSDADASDADPHQSNTAPTPTSDSPPSHTPVRQGVATATDDAGGTAPATDHETGGPAPDQTPPQDASPSAADGAADLASAPAERRAAEPETTADTGTDSGDVPARPGSQSRSGGPRRGKGQLRAEVLQFLTAHRGTAYKVTQLSKLLDASSGAISNALDTLAGEHLVTRTEGQPRRPGTRPEGATFQAN